MKASCSEVEALRSRLTAVMSTVESVKTEAAAGVTRTEFEVGGLASLRFKKTEFLDKLSTIFDILPVFFQPK